MVKRRQTVTDRRATATDAAASERRESRQMYCPICQSPRIRRVARLTDMTACVCEACNAEFIITPVRDNPL